MGQDTVQRLSTGGMRASFPLDSIPSWKEYPSCDPQGDESCGLIQYTVHVLEASEWWTTPKREAS